MRRALASSPLSLLLLTTLVWGGGISCEQYFTFGPADSCCSPDGHCKTKKPPAQQPGRECTQITFDHHKSMDHAIEPLLVAWVDTDRPLRSVEKLEAGTASSLQNHLLDRQVLHATFLI